VDIGKGEAVESDLDAYITRADKRRRKLEGERPKEESYMPGLRRLDDARRKENAWAWLRHHQRQLDSHTRTAALLTAHHEQEIAKYEAMLGITYDEGDSAA
jgi:hypothetical protein